MFNKVLNSAKTLYSPELPRTITYMLQHTNYEVWPYLKWLWADNDFSKIRNQREIRSTPANKLILRILQGGILIEIALGVVLIFLSVFNKLGGGWAFGSACIIGFPVIWPLLICLPAVAIRLLILKDKKATKS